jgi:hypothetical protein
VESHITSVTSQLRGPEQSGSVGHTTVGDLGKAHQIHAVVNNRQAEHQSTVLETSGTIADQTFSILIDPGATERFISGAVLKIIKVKAVEQDEFSYVEMASGANRRLEERLWTVALTWDIFHEGQPVRHDLRIL